MNIPQPVDRDQERLLPIANIARIMKRGLPTNSKISKDAKETTQECASEFISFITSEACDRCSHEKRKTIVADDILWALTSLGFETYTDTLESYLNNYRESMRSASSTPKPSSSDLSQLELFQNQMAPSMNLQMAQMIAQNQTGFNYSISDNTPRVLEENQQQSEGDF